VLFPVAQLRFFVHQADEVALEIVVIKVLFAAGTGLPPNAAPLVSAWGPYERLAC
jgi:hypothetical protein